MLNAAAGPPKGIAKLLTVSESGRMRSPPLVEKFRRAKENMLQNWQSQPVNGKLLSLERMFHEVSRYVCHTHRVHKPPALLCVGSIHPLPYPVWVPYIPLWVPYTSCLTLCEFHTPTASPGLGSLHPLRHPVWVPHAQCLTLCAFNIPTASPCVPPASSCVNSLHPLPHLTAPAALQARLYEFSQ